MSTKHKRYSSAFKAKVAAEAIRGVKTTAEPASEHQVHPTLISQWKRQGLENLASLFEAGSTGTEPEVEAVSAPLYAQIGRLQVEPDWRKRKAERLGCGQAHADRAGSRAAIDRPSVPVVGAGAPAL